MNGRNGFSKITKQARWWWLKDFLQCFPEVCRKKGVMYANKPTIEKFYNLYKDLLKQFNIKNSMHTSNTDESGMQDIPK